MVCCAYLHDCGKQVSLDVVCKYGCLKGARRRSQGHLDGFLPQVHWSRIRKHGYQHAPLRLALTCSPIAHCRFERPHELRQEVIHIIKPGKNYDDV